MDKGGVITFQKKQEMLENLREMKKIARQIKDMSTSCIENCGLATGGKYYKWACI